MSIDGQHIFLVDDEPDVLKSIALTLRSYRYPVSRFATAAECLEQLRRRDCDLLITDVKMPDMDGIELLAEVKRIVPHVPVLLITGYADIPMAVKAMKAGALDFIEKPFNKNNFMQKVEAALKDTGYCEPRDNEPLTGVQKKVLKLILSGRSNKQIALILKRSVRTVEVHRGKIMRKFQVDNIVDLVKRASGVDRTDS